MVCSPYQPPRFADCQSLIQALSDHAMTASRSPVAQELVLMFADNATRTAFEFKRKRLAVVQENQIRDAG
jgi:hypothetical protein